MIFICSLICKIRHGSWLEMDARAQKNVYDRFTLALELGPRCQGSVLDAIAVFCKQLNQFQAPTALGPF